MKGELTMIDKKEITKLAELSKINLTEEEKSSYEKELNKLLDEVEGMTKVDTEDVEITYNVNDMKNSLRNEEVWESLPREEVLKNTSEKQYGYFKILNVMD